MSIHSGPPGPVLLPALTSRNAAARSSPWVADILYAGGACLVYTTNGVRNSSSLQANRACGAYTTNLLTIWQKSYMCPYKRVATDLGG